MSEPSPVPAPTSPPFAEPVKIRYVGPTTFVGSASEWILTNQRVWTALAARERGTAWRTAILAYVVGACVGVCLVSFGAVDPLHVRFGWLLAFILPVLLSMVVLTRNTGWREYDRNVRAGATRWALPGVNPQYRMHLEATPEGIREEGGDIIHINRWSAFEDVVVIDDAVLLLGESMYLMLPRAGIGDAAAVERFAVQADQTLLQGGFHRSQRVPALLAQAVPGAPNGAPWRCWQCRYELTPQGFAGMSDPRCPECGLRLSEHTLRAGAALDYPLWRWILMHLSPRGSKDATKVARS